MYELVLLFAPGAYLIRQQTVFQSLLILHWAKIRRIEDRVSIAKWVLELSLSEASRGSSYCGTMYLRRIQIRFARSVMLLGVFRRELSYEGCLISMKPAVTTRAHKTKNFATHTMPKESVVSSFNVLIG